MRVAAVRPEVQAVVVQGQRGEVLLCRFRHRRSCGIRGCRRSKRIPGGMVAYHPDVRTSLLDDVFEEKIKI